MSDTLSLTQPIFAEPERSASPLEPRVSFAVICYNQEKFIREALNSALAQTFSPLEIVISDDASTDRTFEIVLEIIEAYTGPHRVIVNRNPKNLGLAGNVNKIWELSSGDLVVFQAGDDISKPHRTASLVKTWLSQEPRPDLVYSATEYIYESGRCTGKIWKICNANIPTLPEIISGSKNFIAPGCANSYSRNIHAIAGPIDGNVWAEDDIYTFRALLGNGVALVDEPLVYYRLHNNSVLGQRQIEIINHGFYLSKKCLYSTICNLEAKSKSLEYYGINNRYLSWKLNRRIGKLKIQMQFLEAKIVTKCFLIGRAIFTARIRIALSMLWNFSAFAKQSTKSTDSKSHIRSEWNS